MPTCFVIQPFDKSVFDKRFEDVFEPAIKAAGLEPYRVDRDPGVSIPIEDIERGIQAAVVSLADITTDNPNVWFELGFAIASRKEVVLVSATSRQRFPFDVQHRNVIVYDTNSSSDFASLQDRITKRINAILSKEARLEAAAQQVSSPVAAVEGLASHELLALVSVGQNLTNPQDSVSTYMIRQDMEKAGFTRIAVTLGLTSLLSKGYISFHEAFSDQGESYAVYSLSDLGLKWLMANQDRLVLTKEADTPF